MQTSEGSIWRKWDLHVHTPASILNNQFGSDWDLYVKSLFKAAIKEKIRAIGITDYFLPTGYVKLRTEYLEKPEKMAELFSEEELCYIDNMLILANIEFRLDTTVVGKVRELKYNRRLNYHVLISDDVPCDILMEEFIQKIEFPFDAQTGLSSEMRTLNERNLKDYGNQIKKNQAFLGSDLFVGVMCASVNLNQIIGVLNSHSELRNNYMLGLPADEDLSQVSWRSSGYANRKDLIVRSHFIFSSNDKTRQFLHGELDSSYLQEFGSYKACLWGSDAHDFAKLFKPDEERYTWIKADITFKGLYQVIHEPRTRAYIGPSSPDNKLDYQVIKSVKFISNSEPKLFPSRKIPINPYLNSIIGGKSSGKSLFLYHVAKAINSNVIAERLEILGEDTPYSFDDLDVEVEWRDGSVSLLSETDDTRPITYIPQLYINKLSEKSAQSEFNKLVLDILSQDSDFKLFNDNVLTKIQATSDKVTTVLLQLSQQRKNAKAIIDLVENLGPRNLLEKEMERIQAEITKLSKSSNFLPEEQMTYERFTRRFNIVDKRNLVLSIYQKELEERINELEESKDILIKNPMEAFYSTLNPEPTDSEKALIEPKLSMHLGAAWQEVQIAFNKKKTRVDTIVSALDVRINKYEGILAPLRSRAKDAEKMKTLIEQYKGLSEKLAQIKRQTLKLHKVRERGKEISEELKKLVSQLVTNHYDYIGELDKDKYEFANGLNIKAEIQFNHEGFEDFVDCFDRRKNISELLGNFSADKGFNFNLSSYANDIWTIYQRCCKEDFRSSLKSTTSFEKAIELLFNNWLSIGFNVSYKNDDIIRMSPGKRGLVLLNMILQMSNSSDPVLIDQPEDNLDNRTIYDQLREFMIQNKMKRQILMVTHNANLVVSTDSECVIVSNQNGQDETDHEQLTKFDYLGGSLENSYELDSTRPILNSMGIREHVCQLLEGGELAFKERERKYGFN